MERPTIDKLVAAVRTAFYSTINLPEEILKRRHIRADRNYGLVKYGNVFTRGREISIQQVGNEKSGNWDVCVSYMLPNSEEVVGVRGFRKIQEDDKALEILRDTLNKFFLRNEGEIFNIRGIGLDVGSKERVYRHNIAAFVESKEAGERIVAMFKQARTNVSPEKANLFCFVDGGDPARLDYRPYEPNWIQVKVGACDEHKANLEKLEELVSANDGIITLDIIKSAQNSRALDKEEDEIDY